MKLTSATALLTLFIAVSAIPSEELHKRATCTFWGFTYPCSATTSAATKTTTSVSVSPTRIASSSTTKVNTSMSTTSVLTTKAYTPTTTTVASTTSTSPPTPSTSSTSPSFSGKTAYTSGDTASDIDNNTGCTALTVIYARGTSESGNIGYLAGQFFQKLITDLGATSLTLQGVNYPASTAGNANCGADGGADMANEVKTILARCPDTKIALSGYSQGACVVHNAVQSQGLDNSKISAVVLFGDPFNGYPVGSVPSSKVLEICASGDHVCDGSGTYQITQAHMSYGNNITQAATFIESTTGV